MTDGGRPAALKFHLSRARPKDLSCLGEDGKFPPSPETGGPSGEGGATADLPVAELSRPPNVWMSNVELLVSVTDPFPSLWPVWVKSGSEEEKHTAVRLAMGGLEHPHPMVHFRLLERNTEDTERFPARRRDLRQPDRTSAISASLLGDEASTPRTEDFLWTINLLPCSISLEHGSL